MTYLVDANVLSEPTRPAPSGRVVDWLRANERNLVVDSIIFGELWSGVFALPPGRRKASLERWFEAVVQTLVCVPWDSAVGRRWAELIVLLKRRGQMMPLLDSMIAATALQHGLTVATRNVADFQPADVRVVNPFA